MGKFRLGVIAGGIALTAAFAAPSFAIGNAAECEVEGGTMVKVKGSDFCLVPIRDKAYAGPEYDGNQLGVVECPGSKLNDGAYCMYPVTLRKSETNTSATLPGTMSPSISSSTTVTTDPAMDPTTTTTVEPMTSESETPQPNDE